MVDPGRNYFFVSGTVDRTVYYTTLLVSMFSFLYILIYTFRFSFNKTTKLMNQLSKNSYYVYIIHVIVMGLIALSLLNVDLPVIVKYVSLTILTFVISNIIASAYIRVFQKSLSNNVVTIGVMITAVLLTFTIYAKQFTTGNAIKPTIIESNFVTPDVGLHMAVIEGNLEAVRQHIGSGSDLDEKEPSGGSSPLITAAVFGKKEIAMVLIEAGADVNFKNNEGSTPLHTAAFFCRTEIVEALLANGADKKIINNAGAIALESVTVPFEAVIGIYDYFGKVLGPMGLVLDYERIKNTRPKIAVILL
jgi:hypothetical protein